MLARITGTLETLEGNRAVIAPEGQGGIAYEVLVPAYLARGLLTGIDRASGPVTLHTLQYMESLNQGASFVPRLIGFSSAREREFFELLTSVKGLGNKRALRAMATEPGTIARAIAERDGRFLQSLPEIGPKLAELIVHELKSKVDGFVGMGARGQSASSADAQVEPKSKGAKKVPNNGMATGAAGAPPIKAPASSARTPIRETVDALVALGETPIDAERMVARVIDRARAAGKEPPAEAGELLALAYSTK